MTKQVVTRRQKDISRLLRKRKQVYRIKLKARKIGAVGGKLGWE